MAARKFLFYCLVFWLFLDQSLAFYLSRHPSYPETPLLIHRDNYLKTDQKHEMLIFGNSQPSIGLRPRLIQAYWGRDAYNLSIYVGGLDYPLIALNEYLKHRPAPSFVLWAISPYEMNSRLDFAMMNMRTNLSLNDSNWIFMVKGQAFRLLDQLILNSLFNVYRDRMRWKAKILDHHMFWNLNITPEGASKIAPVAQKDLSHIWEKTIHFYHSSISNDFVRGNLSRSWIEAFHAFCRKKGIKLLILNMPVGSRYGELYFNQDDRWALRRLEKITRENKIPFLDFSRQLPDAAFDDNVHVKEEFFEIFHREIAADMREFLK
jgi:hypothetical protein